MKIFVGFGYHQRDEWIKELVFPLINSFDGDVISGEEIFGAVLSVCSAQSLSIHHPAQAIKWYRLNDTGTLMVALTPHSINSIPKTGRLLFNSKNSKELAVFVVR